MELIGLAIMLAGLSVLSLASAAAFMAFRPLRKLALAIALVPPCSYLILVLSRWAALDSGRVCGPDPEWDRCPSTISNFGSLAAWLIGTSVLAFASFQLQAVLLEAWENLRNKKATPSFHGPGWPPLPKPVPPPPKPPPPPPPKQQ